MADKENARPTFVIGPMGERLTLDTLPSAGTTHWVARRKGEVVAAVNGGLLGLDEACARYNLTIEEFTEWTRAIDRSGLPGLRVTKPREKSSPGGRPRDK